MSPSKSRMFLGRHISVEFKHFLLHSLQFVEGSVPFVYLGVPIFFGKPKISHLQAIADKIIAKFDNWSGSLLSLAGRICLVNNIIASALTHSMMIYRWPHGLIKSIDVALRNFIWNGNVKKRNYGTLAWSRVCSPRREGGLGIRSIRAANESFLFKLAWEILSDKDHALGFIRQRHSTVSGRDVRYHIASSIWHGLARNRDILRQHIRWIPGFESKVEF